MNEPSLNLPLPAHGGGGPDYLERHFPRAPRPWIDLSTGINPWPYPYDEVPAETWRTLPAPAIDQGCRAAAAEYLGVDPRRLALMPGSQAALSLLPRLFPSLDAAVVEPTYAEHAAMWRHAGHRVRAVNDIVQANDADVLILVNPNNPDGRRVPADVLHRLARHRAERGQWLIVDEAFADLTPENALADGGDTTVVLRSFGKFFGLAGVRLGIAVAAPEVARRLEGLIGPWAVSGPALAVAARAYADRAWQTETRARLAAETKRLRDTLHAHGLTMVGGTDLFTLVEHDRAVSLFEALCRNGIYVRRFDYAPCRLRLGLPENAEAFARLEAALSGWATQ